MSNDLDLNEHIDNCCFSKIMTGWVLRTLRKSVAKQMRILLKAHIFKTRLLLCGNMTFQCRRNSQGRRAMIIHSPLRFCQTSELLGTTKFLRLGSSAYTGEIYHGIYLKILEGSPKCILEYHSLLA